MELTIVRRRRLGRGSTRGIRETLEEMDIRCNIWRTDRPLPSESPSLVLRWGCTANLPCNWSGVRVLNNAACIHRVNNKAEFAKMMAEMELGPATITDDSSTALPAQGQWVIRPTNHSRGRNLFVVQGMSGLRSLIEQTGTLSNGWYARPLIKKTAEYRVYVVAGKAAAVARKQVEDTSAVAWNHALGAEFVNVRWGDWPLDLVNRAIQAASVSKLFYAAVDMMVSELGNSWVIEINSAGSLPPNEDGSPSYRCHSVAKAIGWHIRRSQYDFLLTQDVVGGWRDVIHPGVWSRDSEPSVTQTAPVFRSVRAA